MLVLVLLVLTIKTLNRGQGNFADLLMSLCSSLDTLGPKAGIASPHALRSNFGWQGGLPQLRMGADMLARVVGPGWDRSVTGLLEPPSPPSIVTSDIATIPLKVVL